MENGRSEQDKRHILAVEVDADTKRWLERKTAERIIEGRPHGERSMGAVIRDLLSAARESDKELAIAS